MKEIICGKNGFAKVSKNVARCERELKTIKLDHQNNYIGRSAGCWDNFLQHYRARASYIILSNIILVACRKILKKDVYSKAVIINFIHFFPIIASYQLLSELSTIIFKYLFCQHLFFISWFLIQTFTSVLSLPSNSYKYPVLSCRGPEISRSKEESVVENENSL